MSLLNWTDNLFTLFTAMRTCVPQWVVVVAERSYGSFINYVRVPKEGGGVGKISTYFYFGWGGEGVKPILT